MPNDQLTAEEAAEVLRIMRGAGSRESDLTTRARQTLEAIAGDIEIGRTPLIGLVTVNDGGVAEQVCGDVALVDFGDLMDADSTVDPTELDDLATTLERDLSDLAAPTIADLRHLAHERRVASLRTDRRLGAATVAQLTALLSELAIDPAQVTVADVCITEPAA